MMNEKDLGLSIGAEEIGVGEGVKREEDWLEEYEGY